MKVKFARSQKLKCFLSLYKKCSKRPVKKIVASDNSNK